MANRIRKISTGLTCGLCFSIVAVLGMTNVIAYQFSGTITQALCGDGTVVDQEAMTTAIKGGTELAVEISNQGITMLKNKDNVLPIQNNKINVFGYCSSNTGQCFMGYGSGGAGTNGRVYFYDALRTAGFEINENLASAYNGISEFAPAAGYGGGNNSSYKLYEPALTFFDKQLGNGKTLIQDAKDFSDTAVVMITRRGSEDQDWPHHSYNQNGGVVSDVKYSSLSSREKELMQYVTTNFEKVVVVVNSPNVIELGFLDEYDIDGCLSMYLPGNKGNTGTANILKGLVNPSGKTVDTWPYDVSTAPAYWNAGVSGTHSSSGYYYVDYSENIYVGYQWYETADKENFWSSSTAKTKWNVEKYDDVVLYPFGYGLSYTSFDWKLIPETLSVSENSTIQDNVEFAFDVQVTNTGTVKGRDVVELYVEPNYTKGKIEKPGVKLASFAKTHELEPGKSEVLHLTCSAYDIASYDCYDLNNNGFVGYELDEGNFSFSLRTDAHNLKAMNKNKISYSVKNGGIKIDKDPVTNYDVTNRFTTFTNATSGASSTYSERSTATDITNFSVDGQDIPGNVKVKYLSRNNFEDTFPIFEPNRDDAGLYSKTGGGLTPRVYAEDVMPVVGSNATSHKITDLIVAKTDEYGENIVDENGNFVYELTDYNEEIWDELVSQLDLNTLFSLANCGGFGTIAISSIGKNRCVDSDGPCGFNAIITGNGGSTPTTSFPCEVVLASTWNWDLAYQMGLSIGAEGQACGKDGWYAPACNLHRSTLGGRNYEYYSEDPLISGIMAAYSVYGAKENGVYSYVKHFAVNDDECARTVKWTWLTEQNLRENYLKPFEIAVKVGKATGMMSGFNRLGGVRVGGSYNLNTEVLRNEWGFKGTVISDYYQGGTVNDMDESIRAGANLCLSPNNTIDRFDDKSSATAVKAIKEAAKGILYTYIEAKYTALTASGLSLDSYSAKKVAVYPWWIPILVTVDVAVITVCALWAFNCVTGTLKRKED